MLDNKKVQTLLMQQRNVPERDRTNLRKGGLRDDEKLEVTSRIRNSLRQIDATLAHVFEVSFCGFEHAGIEAMQES